MSTFTYGATHQVSLPAKGGNGGTWWGRCQFLVLPQRCLCGHYQHSAFSNLEGKLHYVQTVYDSDTQQKRHQTS